jgi:hypothetical protein
MAEFPNIEHYRGDTFEQIPMVYKVNGTPVDLTDAVIRMQLKKENDGVAYLDLTSEDNDGITITDPTGGAFKINEQDIDIQAGNYVYDIEFNIGGTIETLIKGEFIIINDVTR